MTRSTTTETLTAVDILRALTDGHDPCDYEQGCCDWCGEPVANTGRRRRPHAEACPWRLAVAFLEQFRRDHGMVKG